MKRYSKEEKVKVLLLFEINGFNTKKTCREAGVSKQTLKTWAEQMGVEVFNKSMVADIIHEVNTEKQYSDELFKLKGLIGKIEMLQQMIDMLPDMKHPKYFDVLSRGVKIMHELHAEKKLMEEGSSKYNTQNFVQILVDQLNINNK